MGREEIAADYVAIGLELVDFYARQAQRQKTEERRRIAPFAPTAEDDVLQPLVHLDAVWGGARAYLAAYGFSAEEQAALQERLLEGG